MVENKSIAELFSKIFNPYGPTITPAMISPIIPGILTFFKRIGKIRMMKRINEKMSTGLLRGVLNSDKNESKKPFITFYTVEVSGIPAKHLKMIKKRWCPIEVIKVICFNELPSSLKEKA